MTARGALALGSAMLPFPALAQTPPEGLSEIVVTAQRREESLRQTWGH